MTRLPIRWRVTLAFSVALLVVLVAVGAFIYLRQEAVLGRALDRGLQARAAEVGAVVVRSPGGFDAPAAPGLESDESVAQVLRADGTVVASSLPGAPPLLDAEGLRRARAARVFIDRPGDAALDESLRLLAGPARAGGEALVVVVGASREENDEALSSLLLIELLGLGAALVLASAAGYAVAGVALRPVEAMRRRAEEITDAPNRRLPQPPVADELGRLAATLNAMLDRLEGARAAEREAAAAERRFVADASHELRTPLTILKSEIEVALLGDRRADELEAALSSAGEETDRLCRLADDLLVLARADEGRPDGDIVSIDVGDLLRAVGGREARRAELAGRPLVVEAPAGLTVDAGRPQLERAIGGLIDNALRHGAGPIELAAEGMGGGVVSITVRDHGPGFPDDFLPRAFERFSRADAGRSGGGSGLGLAIVAAVVRRQGGSVDAGNAGPGAWVRIALPASAGRSSSSHPPSGTMPSSSIG